MSDEDDNTDARPRRFHTLRFNPLREVLPWVVIVVGVFQFIRAATGAMDSVFLIIGPVLIVIGISALFLARWMKKRGI